MEDIIRRKLIELAREKTTWPYSRLNEQLELGLNLDLGQDRGLMGEWLGSISNYEFNKGRPVLSCIVTLKQVPKEFGDGFYKLCSELYGIDWEILKADKKWENKLISDCYEFWSNAENYKKYKDDYE